MRALVLLLGLVTLAGCATPYAVHDRSAVATLVEVNRTLGAAPVATIHLTDGESLRSARDVVVSEVDVRYVRDGRPFALPVERVESIYAQPGRRTGQGAAIGAVPGLALIGLAGVGVANSGDTENVAAGIAIVFIGLAGVGVAVVGAGLGALVGSQAPSGPMVRLYEGPVSRYVPTPGGVEAPSPPD